MPAATLAKILAMPDPDKKFLIVSRHWATEETQRNEGLRILREEGCDWCLIVDDDEMYNRGDFAKVVEFIDKTVDPSVNVFAIHALVYWKDRKTVIMGLPAATTTLITTSGRAFFKTARTCLTVGSAIRIPPEVAVMHHFSYVGNDARILRKIQTFSHASETSSDWFERVWLKWHPDMENLHPNPKAPSAFRRAVSAVGLPWILEDLPTSL